ncbi:DUF992 domain-containing protein [Coralliovum pocilloporae]|uniref:DUF992 domain-containing protein n=1 Tax=Coralliovum pocilloporae TaxID=3066369 RepID=UPI0033072B02
MTFGKYLIPTAALIMASVGVVQAADLPSEPVLPEVRGSHAEQDAEAYVKVGVLVCESEGGFGYLIGSSKDLACTFDAQNAALDGAEYSGRIVKVGADVGYTAGGVLAWAVLAPAYDVPASGLDGTYLGVSAEASAGIGAGANVLMGSFERSINLVPVSVSGTVGLNVAGGLGAITLTSIN